MRVPIAVAALALLALALAFSSGERRPAGRLGATMDPSGILALRGDFERGRELIFDSTLQCRACHRFGTGDEKVGPDLGQIGAKYDRRKLLETILDPSKEIDPKYATYLVETAGGAVYSGILVEKTGKQIVLQDAEKITPIPAESVKRMGAQKKSIMADFLLQDLTPQEAADVLEFLQGMK